MVPLDVTPDVAQMLAQCGSARELFDLARDCARDAEAVRRHLAQMEAREGVRGMDYSKPNITSTATSTGFPATEARLDYEAAKSQQVELDEGVMDSACAVLWGEDMRGGAAALTSETHAQVVWWHWLALAPWPEVAQRVGYSDRQCQRMAQELFDVVDGIGISRTLAGMGVAED